MQEQELLEEYLAAIEEVEDQLPRRRNAFYTQVENMAPRYGLQLEFSRVDLEEGQGKWDFFVGTDMEDAVNRFEDFILTAANEFSDLVFAPIEKL